MPVTNLGQPDIAQLHVATEAEELTETAPQRAGHS